jgi:hypothetical protein
MCPPGEGNIAGGRPLAMDRVAKLRNRFNRHRTRGSSVTYWESEAHARPRTVQQITTYLKCNGVDAEVIACAGYFRFRGGDPPGGWVLPNLLGFSLDGMSFGDWLRAYQDVYAAHEAFYRERFRHRGVGFALLDTKWTAKLLEHQQSTAQGRPELREIGRRLSRFEVPSRRC